MPGITQASWFIDKIWPHFPELNYSDAVSKIMEISEEEYMFLKRLYFRAYASSDNKAPDDQAAAALKLQLNKLGIL